MSQGHARSREARGGRRGAVIAGAVAVLLVGGAAGWAFTSGPLGDDGGKKTAASDTARTKAADAKKSAKAKAKTKTEAKAKGDDEPKPPLMTTAPRTGTHKAARAAAGDWSGSSGAVTTIQSAYSWQCLDGGYDRNDETWAQGNPGDVAYQFPCAKGAKAAGPDQNWRLKAVKPGVYQIRNVYSGNCIAAESVNAQGWGTAALATCDHKRDQLWRFTRVAQAGGGIHGYFSSYAHPQSALNLENKSKQPLAKISLWKHEGPPQEWVIVNPGAL